IHTRTDTGLSVPIQSVTTREASGGDTTATATPRTDTASPGTEAPANKPLSGSGLKEYGFVNDAGKVRQVEVTTGIQDDTYNRVVFGLSDGDEAVTSPFNAISRLLTDGRKVEKVDANSLF